MNNQTVKSVELSAYSAAVLIEILNLGKVIQLGTEDTPCLHSKIKPCELILPEGWYYANGVVTNKHNTTTGTYETIVLLNQNGELFD